MHVKVGNSYSHARTAPGGSPQGSILGNFLFCACTNEFTERKVKHLEHENAEVIHNLNTNYAPDNNSEASNEWEPESSFTSDFDLNESNELRFFRPNKMRLLDDTVMSVRLSQSQIDAAVGVPEGWVRTDAEILAYIDDLNIVEKIRHCDAVSNISTNKQISHVHAPQSQ